MKNSNTSDYLHVNKANWNSRVPVHVTSEFYQMDGFLQGRSSLHDIELKLLGNIRGKSILHLQCHFGQDSISLARMGAKVTGVDFSEEAIAVAKELAVKSGVDASFVCCDIYSLPDFLQRRFDIVFTSYGVIGWLPHIDKWAYIISKYLVAGGYFIMAEFHPVVWMFDNDFTKVAYRYFKDEAIIETDENTYTDQDSPIENQTSITWNHSLSEVMSSLITQRLQIISFTEYDYSPYNCFTNMEKVAENKYVIKNMGNKIPMVYSIKARKVTGAKQSLERGR